MNIAVLDDEQQVLEELKGYIERHCAERGTDVSVALFSDAVAFLEGGFSGYDIIFLDIEMPYRNGMQVAEEIRKRDENVILIFVTNMAQYALKGYEMQAYSFVVKPVRYKSFSSLLERALRQAERNSAENFILVGGEGNVEKLNVAAITYIEVWGHRTTYHCNSRETVGRETLKSLEESLKRFGFSRCNHCYLVNLRYVKSVDGMMLTLTDGTSLAVSQSRKKEFMQQLAEYING